MVSGLHTNCFLCSAITAGCFDLNEPASIGGLPMNLLLLLMAVGVACSDGPMNLLLLLMAVGVACTVAPDALLNREKILDIRRILCGSLTKDCLPTAPLLFN